MRRLFQKKNAQDNAPQRGKGLPLSWPVLLMFVLALGCTVIWAFIMGFLVGRGHNPETHLREITGFQEAEKPLTDMTPREPGEQAGEMQDVHESEIADPKTAPRFPEPSDEALTAWGDKKDSPTAKAAPDKPNASQKTSKTPNVPKKATKDPSPAKVESKKGEQYEFTYQLAAFKSSGDAEKFKSGLFKTSARIESRKSGKVYLVLAHFRGTEKTEQDFLAKIRGAGSGKPLRLSRKAVVSAASNKARGKK